MSKLKTKTVKDIERISWDREANSTSYETYIREKELRQEVIKLIKDCEFKDIPLNKNNTRIVAGCNSKHRCEVCLRFMNFFNITEEKLKQNE